MLNKKILNEIIKLSEKPTLFEKGTGNIWTEPYIANQMLKAHLDQSTEAASRKEESIDKTVDFINRYIKKGSAILDLGCGPGLYAERLCKDGHKVTGIDFSTNSIEFARHSARSKGLEIDYVCRSFFDIEYDACYDVAMQIYGELSTFSNEERNKLIILAQKSLKPGGIFIFDVMAATNVSRNINKIERNWYASDKGFWREDEHLVLEEKLYYEDDIRLEQFTVVDNDEVKVYRNWFHEYTKETIEPVVLAGGFSKVQVIQNLFEQETKEQSEWLTVIAYK